MNLHLIRSSRYEKAAFAEVVRFLSSFEGPMRFVPNEHLEEEEDEEVILEKVNREHFYTQHMIDSRNMIQAMEIPRERPVESWPRLFGKVHRYRQKYRVPKDDMVLLLTPVANEKNWFSALDPHQPANGFVHTGEWAHFVRCPETFPVAYLVVSEVLRRHMFRDLYEGLAAVHQVPLGCFNDFCAHKKEIILKLRTADICYDCITQLKEKADPLLVQQALNIFEGVRLRILFAQNFRQRVEPSELVVSKQNRIFLPAYGNIEIRLTPLEKTLYLFFLRHPEGVMLHDLVDHRRELREIYGLVTNSGVLSEITRRVELLIDVTSNSASEKISKVKKAFVAAIGKDLAEHYIIKGGNGQPKSVELDRRLVTQ